MTRDQHMLSIGPRIAYVPAGTLLIDALADLDIFLPTACGGRGSCGSCRCQINAPQFAHSPKEIPYLSEADRQQGIHLACQCTIKSDISVSVPAVISFARRLSCQISQLEQPIENVMLLNLTLPPISAPWFKAGQYALIESPIRDSVNKPVRRSFSFASSPSNLQSVRFLAALAPGGMLSQYLQYQAKIGDIVQIIGPFGSFSSFEDTAPEIWIASGSGIAPFLSMAQDHAQVGKKNITIIYSGKNETEMPCLAEIKGLCVRSGNIRLIIHIAGRPGRSIPDYLNQYLSTQAIVTESRFLLCAHSSIIDACINVLHRYGVNSANIRSDHFF